MRIEEEVKLDYSDVLFRPKRSTLKSRKEVDLSRTYKFKHSNREWSGVPIIASNMDGVGELDVAKSLSKYNIITSLTKQHNLEKINLFPEIKDIFNYVAISCGTSPDSYERLNSIISQHTFIQFICIDVANGYSENFSNFVSSVREKYPSKTIIAGNVVTADMAQELILSGADIVKVGIGPGSVCTTRIQTGVGYPQLSAVMECADATHGLGGHMIADGGCTCPGDVAKAFGGGADFVMLGGMLAGHDECAGDMVAGEDGTLYKTFYGMSSDTAMNKHSGGVATYRASEGKTVRVEYRGPVENTMNQILGGIRSACTYTGARTLKQLPKCTTFIRVKRQLNTVFGNE